MAEEKDSEESLNVISDHTGQYDARFVLWRAFCAEYNVSVETLPSELTGEARDKWDEIKERQLHKPVEGR